MDLAEFKRAYPLRVPNLMWFLGAGTSAASNVPTAFDMIWDFKRSIFSSEKKIPIKHLADLSDTNVRTKIQAYFNGVSGAPAENSPEEYSYYFERAYPSEADRRTYIEGKLSGSSPCYGHLVMAALVKLQKIKIIWTTNFDRLPEDAIVKTLGTMSTLIVATLSSADTALEAMNGSRFPLLVKPHGDYQYRQLKNTSEELREQDGKLRHALIEGCKRSGLAIVGYSGRDLSIIQAMEAAIEAGHAFPGGLFWFTRDTENLLQSVKDLMEKAAAANIDAHIIQVETFDELMGDIIHSLPDVPDGLLAELGQSAKRVSNVPLPPPAGIWPIIKTNAFPITVSPSVCRRIACTIGGIKEVKETIEKNGNKFIAGRRNVGVIAFGSDADIKKAFEDRNITEFDVHSIETRRLKYDSQELGLIYDALSLALVRNRPLLLQHGRNAVKIFVDPQKASEQFFGPLKRVTSQITGTTGTTRLKWAEAVRIRAEFKLERLWLLIEPTIWTEKTEDLTAKETVKEFIRERSVKRYNRQWSDILDAWSEILLGKEPEITLRALGITTGIDAEFTIMKQSAFSWRKQ